MDTILLVDDEPQILQSQESLLRLHDYHSILTAGSVQQAQARFETTEIAMAIVDLSLHEESGLELIRWIHHESPSTVVLVVTGASELSLAVECMRAGAYDFLVKGSDSGRFPAAVRNALAHRRSELENRRLRGALFSDSLKIPAAFKKFTTRSRAMQNIIAYLDAVAPLPDPVLITGETGVGKELIARAVHTASGRTGPFLAVNLGGLDDQSVSDTLFGHVRGAYTDAHANREGLLRAAAGGTLLLDEFADISIDTQVKLLRLIDSGEFMSIGSDNVLHAQTRLVFATNRDLQVEITRGHFRRDLYFRISSHLVEIPPLRDRPEDIEPILLQVLSSESKRLGRTVATPTPELLEHLTSQPLLGNVRELQQLVVAALVHGSWRVDSFPGPGRQQGAAPPAPPQPQLQPQPQPPERDFPNSTQVAFGSQLPTPTTVIEALLIEADRRYPNNRTQAAQAIGLSPQAFANRWKRMSET